MKLTEQEIEEAIEIVKWAACIIDPDSEDGERDFDFCSAADLATEAKSFLDKIGIKEDSNG